MKLFNKSQKHTDHTKPWLSITICFGSALLFLILGAAPETLIYNRSGVEQGELWRLLSNHFVHCDISHLGWNLAALFILGSLLERRIGARLLGLTVFSCLGGSSWLWFIKTDLTLYCGLSGMLNSLFTVLLFIIWRERKHPILPLLAIAAVLKIFIEVSTQQSIFTHMSWNSVPSAHGAGMITGIFYYYLFITKVPKERVPRTRFLRAYEMEHEYRDLQG